MLTLHFVVRILVGADDVSVQGARWIGKADDDPLLFFCDVDMIIKPGFLDRCISSAVRGNDIYFPMVFSQYHHGKPIVGEKHGEWRHYGFGMLCAYRSDFLSFGGYDNKITGWGEEDYNLFERLVRKSTLNVHRAVEQGLIHKWHSKTCDPALSEKQLRHCKRSAMAYEGSKSDLGEITVSLMETLGMSSVEELPVVHK